MIADAGHVVMLSIVHDVGDQWWQMSSERRIERECLLRCARCHAAPFVVYRRQVRRPDGTLGEAFENVIWPNGSGIEVPREPDRCPACGDELRRVTG